MQNIQLSIIIPHYNSPDRLKRMLKSIGVHNDIQVIVVDDGSIEGLDEYTILKSEYSHVEFYDNPADNKSAGGARNVGLSHAVGKWVMFGDADDYFLSDYYDSVKDYFYSKYDVIFFPPIAVIEGTEEKSDRCDYYNKLINKYYRKIRSSTFLRGIRTAPLEKEIRENWVTPWSRLIRRDLLEEEDIRFEVVKYANDNFFSIKLACHAKRMTASDKEIYTVTESTRSLTKNNDPTMAQIRKDVWDRCINYMNENENRSVKMRARIAETIWRTR